MSTPVRVVVVSNRGSEKLELLRALIGEAVPIREKELSWLSEFTLSPWSRSEIASGVAFDDVLKIKPHLLIIDGLVLLEKDAGEHDRHRWLRGLKLLQTLYENARRLGREHDLPKQVVVISDISCGREDEEFQNFDFARNAVAEALCIAIDFFERRKLSQPSTDEGGARGRFRQKIMSEIARRGDESQT